LERREREQPAEEKGKEEVDSQPAEVAEEKEEEKQLAGLEQPEQLAEEKGEEEVGAAAGVVLK